SGKRGWNRMKALESRALASKFKEALKDTRRCSFEIRSAVGNATGQRLHHALTLAGVKAHLIEAVAPPSSGILIETSQECAGVGLSIQTAFKTVGLDAHLLVQVTRDPNTVVIHLNSDEPPAAPKKTSGHTAIK